MRAGKLNRRIEIWRPKLANDGGGGQARSWAFVGHRRVAARPSGGAQVDVSNMLTNDLSWRIDMRQTRIETGWRIVLDGVNYRVRSVVDPTGKRRDLAVLADREIEE